MRSSVFVALLLSLSPLCRAQATAWDYQGTQGGLNWGKLDSAYKTCSQGHQQSPIDIRGAHLNAKLGPLEFHYRSGAGTMQNDGHTVVVTPAAGSYFVASGVRYDLASFDFHNPSEHAVRGRLSDMEIHLTHRDAEGHTAILAVRLIEDVNTPNAVLATLWKHLPAQPGAAQPIPEFFNPAGLLPAEHGYWSYTGSLSTPPCTEGVRWFVMEDEVPLGRDQLRAFLRVFRTNTRAIQETRSRRIEANQ